jgi:ParB-like chromosome segregation protein Spo0J
MSGRWRAAELAGKETIPALIDGARDDAGSPELALIENVVREDLTAIEQARTLAVLLGDLRMTGEVLAKRLGRSRADIVNMVRLLDLPDEAIELIDSGALSKGHGKALLTEPDHHRRRSLARHAADGGWSVRALEAEIARSATPPAPRPSPHPDQCAAAARLRVLSQAPAVGTCARASASARRGAVPADLDVELTHHRRRGMHAGCAQPERSIQRRSDPHGRAAIAVLGWLLA